MKISLRIAFSILFFGSVAVAATMFLSYGYWIAIMSVIIGLWKILRDIYLSNWEIRTDDESITVINNKNVRRHIQYSEICRVQELPCSIRIMIHHLVQRPELERMINDTSVQFALPVGAERCHVVRRLWTLSRDLLVQSSSGQTLLFPLSALDGTERRKLWTQLRLKAPSFTFEQNASLGQKAMEEEQEGDRLVLDRQWEQARHHYQNAIDLWERSGHMDSVARCLRHIVDCFLRLGRFSEAAGLATQALELARNLGHHRGVAYSLNQLSETELNIGGLDGLKTAIKYVEEAKQIYIDLKLPFMECRMFGNQAIIYERMFLLTGESFHLDECQRLAEKAIAIIQDTLSRDRSANIRMQEANLLGSLARCNFHREIWNDASDLFESESDISDSVERIITDDLIMWGRSLFASSQDVSSFGSDSERLQMLHRAMEKLNRAVRLAQVHGDLNELLQVYVLRADTFWDMGNLKAAVRDYEMVIGFLEGRRIMLERPFDRVALLRRYRRAYIRTIEALLQMAEENANQPSSLIERAFQHCERARARNLAEQLNLSTILLANVPSDLRRAFEDAEKKQRDAYLQMESLQKATERPDSEDLQQAYERLQQAQQDYEREYSEITRKVPGFADLTSPRVPSISEIQSWLPLDGSTAVMEFSIGENALCVFIIAREAKPVKTCLTINGLGSKGIEEEFLHNGCLSEYEAFTMLGRELELLEEKYFRQWYEWKGKDGLNIGGNELPQELISLKSEIEEKYWNLGRLWGEWTNLLPDLIDTTKKQILTIPGSCGESICDLLERLDIKRLVIIPDGILHRLPIHAAIKKEISVSYAPSSAILIQAVSQNVGTPSDALIVANPDHRIVDLDYRITEAEYEANLIQNRLSRNGIAVSKLERDRANSDAIIAEMGSHSWLHFCGHATSNFRSPLESHLKVAGTDDKHKGDLQELWESRFLKAKRIMAEGSVRSGAWIMLDACETGISPEDPSGEYVGLPAAFLAAGAAIVISTLWEVDVGTPIVVMDRFYDNILQKKLSVPAAMRESCQYLESLTLEDIGNFERCNNLPGGTVTSSLELNAGESLASYAFHWAPFIVCGAGWSVHEAPKDAMQIGFHQEKLPELPTQAGVGRPPQVNKAIKEADKLINERHFMQAVSILTQALKTWGSDANVHERLGSAYTDLGNFPEACTHYLEVLYQDPNSFPNHYNMGWIYREFGHIAEARGYFKQALNLNPSYVHALKSLSELTNDPKEAMEYLQKAKLIKPDDNEVRESMKMWRKLSNEGKDEIVMHRLIWAQEALDKGNLPYARMHLDLARQEAIDDNTKAESFRIESDILRKEDDIRDSIIALETARILDPTKPNYWNTLAARRLILLSDPSVLPAERESMINDAEKECLEAISLDDYAKPHINLALVYLRSGSLDEARKHAILANDMTKKQMRASSKDEIVCGGCPTQGENLTECQKCSHDSLGVLRDTELASGDFRVE